MMHLVSENASPPLGLEVCMSVVGESKGVSHDLHG